MSKPIEEQIWERVKAGQHAIAVGFPSLQPPLGLSLVRVSCDVPHTTLGPIVDARRKIEQVLDHQSALFAQARVIVVTGLRRRFLGRPTRARKPRTVPRQHRSFSHLTTHNTVCAGSQT